MMFQSQLISATLGDWRSRNGPLYARLADALADAIARGDLGGGSALPAERLLAAHLGVSRGTVVAAFDALRARRLLQTRRGSGTVITAEHAASGEVRRSPLLSLLVEDHRAPIDLAIGAPQLDGELPDVTVSLRDAARSAPSHGYVPLGIGSLREAIAEHMGAGGVATSADQVVVTAGGQGALSLIASTLLRAGDRVLVEAPTYPAAIEVFGSAGARVEGVDRDDAGMLPDELERALENGPVRLLYLVPTCHNPTGGVMSERRRREICALARRRGITIVEDCVLAPLLLHPPGPPALAAIDPDGILTVGSLSKSVWGGLRVGWVRASSETTLRLGRVKAAADMGGAVLSQVAALRVLRNLDELLAQRRQLVAERLGVLTIGLSTLLPEWQFVEPLGGWSVWVRLPYGSGDDLAQLALRRGVAISSGRSAAPDDRFAGYVRLAAGPPAATIEEGVRRLAEAWEDLRSLPRGSVSEPALTV